MAGADLDAVIRPFYRDVLASYWPPERRHVDDGYRALPFPFAELDAPAFEIRLEWRLADLAGYVGTWSAVWALEQAEGPGPFATFRRALEAAWGQGPATTVRTARWPLVLRVGRVTNGVGSFVIAAWNSGRYRPYPSASRRSTGMNRRAAEF